MKIINYWLFFSFFALLSGHTLACNLNITIDNIQSNEGELLLGVYKISPDTTNWPAEPNYTASFPSPEPGSLTHCFTIDEGLYSIRVLQDLNQNKLNDRNASGIPTESFGLSYQGAKAFPLVSETAFEVNADTVNISITLKHPQTSHPTK